jgi:Ca2+-transporting ATPase
MAGLSSQAARERLARWGPNDIEASEQRGWLATARGIAREPMFVLLIVAAGVYLAIGDLAEGLLLGAFAALTVALVFLQERRSEHALDALRALAAPHVRVKRDGRVTRIPARELVPGDLFLLSEGERVPADAVLRECEQMTVDESLLSGESAPVRKLASDMDADAEAAAPGGDDTPFVFAGTLITAGHAEAEVIATGPRSQAGRIGLSLASIAPSPTPLQLHLRRLVAWLGAGAIAMSAVLVLWWGLMRGRWVDGLLSGIASAMAMLPEEFPMALSVFLALGAWRLAQVKVLARRPAVIEALGGATVLCVDKTGTLTENRMRLRRLIAAGADVDLAKGEGGDLPESAQRLLEYAVLASRRDGVEPMDRAVAQTGDRALANTQHLHPSWVLEREYPLSPRLLAISHAWTAEDGSRRVATKGAPEAVVGLCRLPPAEAAAIARQVARLADQGLRVLGVAGAAPGPGNAAEDAHEYEFRWLGLIGFEDPLRASVPQAVAQAHRAGIAVAMITGDHAQTALAIAREAGIETAAGALTGAQIETMGDRQLAEAAKSVRVFARVLPHQKLRLVQAFRANGEVVAMTGDGVNDAPALKAAHIGIAMGVRGTDVAREAAGLVLLDEDFGRIVGGVRMGRRIFDNLRKVMTYITAIHVPIAGLALVPVVLGVPPMMLPAHVVLTEMIIDPVCSLAFEGAPEMPGTMERPPRRSDDALVGWAMLWRGLLQGAFVLAGALGVYLIALPTSGVESARAQALVALTVGNLGLVWLNASLGAGWRAVFGAGYGAFWLIAAVASAVMAAALSFEAPRELLRVELPSPSGLALALFVGAAAVMAAAIATRVAAAVRPRGRGSRGGKLANGLRECGHHADRVGRVIQRVAGDERGKLQVGVPAGGDVTDHRVEGALRQLAPVDLHADDVESRDDVASADGDFHPRLGLEALRDADGTVLAHVEHRLLVAVDAHAPHVQCIVCKDRAHVRGAQRRCHSGASSRITSTGTGAKRMICSAPLPSRTRPMPWRP